MIYNKVLIFFFKQSRNPPIFIVRLKPTKEWWCDIALSSMLLLQLVEYKQQARLEEKRKKALDQHLSFIMDQTEKYSSLVAESMNKPGLESVSHSVVSSRAPSPSNLLRTSDGGHRIFGD